MKKNNSQFSILNSQLLLLVVMLLAVGCNLNHHNEGKQPAVAADSLNQSIALLEQIIQGPELVRDFKARTGYINTLDSLAGCLPEAAERAAAWLKAGQLYHKVSCYEPAERVLLKAQREAEKIAAEKGAEVLADILLARGQLRVNMSDFAEAARLLSEAGNYYEEKKKYEKLVKVYTGQVAAYQHQYTSAPLNNREHFLERENYFLNKLGDLYSEMEEPIAKSDCLNALISYAINKQEYEQAKIYLTKLDSLARSCNYTQGLIACYGNGGIVAEKQGNLKEGMALQYKAYETALAAGNMAVAAQALANAAFDAKRLGEYTLMRSYSLMGVALAKEYDIKSQWWRFLDNLSSLAESEGKYKQALDYRNECVNIYVALYSENNANQINQYAARFESLQKENKINELQAEAELYHYKSRQKNQLIFFLSLTIVLSVAIFVVLLLYRRRLAKKQEQIARQRIQQLEQEKQLIATQAVLDGETRERARLARDLHDGLGSMLTGAKLKLLEMKKGATLQYTDVERFDKALGLLDQSVREMRRVAHHLMPDSLSRFGLKSAVDEFCRSLSANVAFDYFGNEARLDPKIEVVVYRCIHELVNNALKYSGANQIMVQIMQEPGRIAFIVQDDGCGFDTSIKTQGMGLENIRTRIASFGGNIQIDSTIGEGTEVNVELKIEN